MTLSLIQRNINALDNLIEMHLLRDLDCLAHIDQRDKWEEFRHEWKVMCQSLPYCESTL